MDTNSIFVPQSRLASDDISGKITYTNVIETIPEDSTESPIENWREQNKTEWRWRFLDLPDGRQIVEISFMNPKSKNRRYFNKHGEWVKRFVDPVYDRFVKKEYYYYSNN